MPRLTPGKPVTTEKPLLLVENGLDPGRYRFELVVLDDSGLESAPAELLVEVRGRPVGPVLDERIIDIIRRRRDPIINPFRQPR